MTNPGNLTTFVLLLFSKTTFSQKFYYPNTTLTHAIIGHVWNKPPPLGTCIFPLRPFPGGICREDYYNVTYPLVPVLNLTKVSDNELREIVGEKLAKSFDNAVSVDKKEGVSSIFDSLTWPMRNGSSIIRGAAMFEYLKRKSKVWKNRFVPLQKEESFYAQLTLSLMEFEDDVFG